MAKELPPLVVNTRARSVDQTYSLPPLRRAIHSTDTRYSILFSFSAAVVQRVDNCNRPLQPGFDFFAMKFAFLAFTAAISRNARRVQSFNYQEIVQSLGFCYHSNA